MASITTWNRLEPLPKTHNLRSGLRAEIADPLWLITRQRQFGELRGEDAGSPIQAKLRTEAARIARYRPGALGPNPASDTSDHDDTALPLETLVERQSVWDEPGSGRLRVDAGLHFVRLLRKHQAATKRGPYVKQYGFKESDLVGEDRETKALRRAVVDRVIDGRALYEDLRRARGRGAVLTDLPNEPDVGSDANKILVAANEFLDWFESYIVEPRQGRDAWKSDRLEHGFSVQANLPGGRVVLVADEYPGGRLDWYHFRTESRPNLGDSRRSTLPDTIVRTVIPAPVSYGGMPANRYWEVEDGSVRFGGLSTGRTDLARLLLSEFALAYGNDWFVIPVDLPVGSICEVGSLVVRDTFGEETTVESVNRESRSGWQMFNLSAKSGAASHVKNLLFLPPVLLETQESAPLEEVAFIRDEMANVVWGVERVVASEAGTPIDRYEQHQQRIAAGASQRIEVDVGDAELVYRLQSYVPDHWHPFVPVLAPDLKLELREIQRHLSDGSVVVVAPEGRILNAAHPLRVEEEEVPRSGVVVSRTFQLTRWLDGRTLVWSGTRKRIGRGEGSSGLQYDTVRTTRSL